MTEERHACGHRVTGTGGSRTKRAELHEAATCRLCGATRFACQMQQTNYVRRDGDMVVGLGLGLACRACVEAAIAGDRR